MPRRNPNAGEYILAFLGGAVPGYFNARRQAEQANSKQALEAQKLANKRKTDLENVEIKGLVDTFKSNDVAQIQKDEAANTLRNKHGIDLGVATPKPVEKKEDTFFKDQEAHWREQQKVETKATEKRLKGKIDPDTFRFTKEGTDLGFKYTDRAMKMSDDYTTIQNNLGNISVSINRLQNMPTDERNKIAVNQAIITSYNKITDPSSVVRESEYERTPEGAALLNRLRGAYEKISQGGLLTEEDLIEIKETAAGIAELQRTLVNEKLEQQIREPARKRYLDPEEIAPLFKPIGSYIKPPKTGESEKTLNANPEIISDPDEFINNLFPDSTNVDSVNVGIQ